jgi:aldose 1-epimerase
MTENQISIAAGNLSAEFLPDSGMLGVSLHFRGKEVLRRIDDLEAAKGKGSTAGIPILYPWANRLAGLTYNAAGREVKLHRNLSQLHFDDHGLPMHGVPWGKLAWEIRTLRSDAVLAALDWNSSEFLEVFPFPHRVEMWAEIAADSLTLRTTVFANSGCPVPISFGFHPYFGIPDVPRSQWRLQLPGMRKLTADDRGIPTGTSEPFGPLDEPLADHSFDNGFALESESSSFVLSGAPFEISVSFLEGFPFTQVFAPQDKQFIAIEPMTAATNALVSGEGLRTLPAGSNFLASFRIAVRG